MSDDSQFLPEPSDDLVRQILAKHGFAHELDLERVPLEGSVNYVRLAGDVCIKLLKWPDMASDVFTEAVATPAAYLAGVKTPKLLAFDNDCDLHPGPVSIWQRLPGETLGSLLEVPDLKAIYVQIAEQARLWHEKVSTLDDPNDWLDKPESDDPFKSLERCADRMEPEVRAWCQSFLEHLNTAKPGQKAFVHWDLHAHNVLVENDKLSAVLDWGDAGFGDPVINFTCFPAEFLPEVVEAFGMPDEDFIGRLIREVTGYALNAYNVEDWPTLRHTGMKRWRSLEALYARDLGKEWQRWLGDAPPPSLGASN